MRARGAADPHARVEHGGEVGEEHGLAGDAPRTQQAVRLGHGVHGGSDDRCGIQRLEAQPLTQRRVQLAVARQLGDDGVHLALVAVVGRRASPALDHGCRGRRRVLEPPDEGGVRVAGRHHDRCLDDRAVVELDASNPVALAEDGADLGRRAQGPTGRGEGSAHRVRHSAAAAHWPAHPGHVLHGVRQRAQAGARRVRREAPDRRADDDGRCDQRVRSEEVPQHVGHAPAAPAQQVADATGAPPGDLSQHGARRRRLVGQLDQQLRHGHGGLQVAAVAVDLAGMGQGQAGHGPLWVAEERPGRTLPVQQAQLGRIDVDVAQAVGRQVQLLRHRSGAEQDVIAVADVHPGAERVHRRGTAADGRSGLEQQHVQAGAGQVGGADQPVVTGSDDDGAVIHDGHCRRARRA